MGFMTLEEILNSREARVARQRELLEANPGLSLISLTVQPPGPVKRNDASLVIARAGVEAVRKAFKVEFEELRDLDTGFEGFFLVNMDPLDTKSLACVIEDTHSLGRLMDLDVIVLAGAAVELRPYSAAASEAKREWTRPGSSGCPAETTVVPIGREELGLGPRKCLLCDRPARECMRARSHSTEELLEKYKEIVNLYLKM